MNRLLIKKLKQALDSTHPLESVKEIIDEFEEVDRLIRWREKIIISGENLDKHKKELDNISKLMVKYEYPEDFYECCLENRVRKYIEDFKKEK